MNRNHNKVVPFGLCETQLSSNVTSSPTGNNNINMTGIIQKQLQDQQIQQSQCTERNDNNQKSDTIISQSIQYDPDVIPPNFSLALQHRQAMQVGGGLKEGVGNTITYCKCCARRVETPYISLNCSLIELSFIGSGYPLYFTFIKFLTWILIIMFLSSGVFNTIGGFTHSSECQESSDNGTNTDSSLGFCNNDWTNKFTVGNKKDATDILVLQSVLNFFCIILIVLLLHYFRYKQRKRDQDCDDADISANDYAFLIHNIPLSYDALNDDYDDDLKDFLEKNAFPNKKINIEHVNLCYDLEELQQLEKVKQNIIKKKQEFLKNINLNSQAHEVTDSELNRLNIFDHKINQTKIKLNQLEYKFCDGKGKEFMKKYFAGYAIISVETEQEKEDMIKLYAPYPTDILWQNLKLTNSQKRRRNIIGMLYTAGLLSFCFSAIYGLQTMQRTLILSYNLKSSVSSSNSSTSQVSTQTEISSKQKIQSQLISILISFVITFINIILRNVLNKIAQLEGHPTVTQFNISASRKVSLVQFLNSSLIIFFIQIYISVDHRTKLEKIYGVGGLVENQNYVFIFNMILPPIIEMIDINGKVRSWKRKKEELKGKKSILTQKQLNDLYEDPPYNIPLRYSSLLNTMFMTSFYSPILPLSILYSLGSLLFTYWIDKYNVLYRRTIKNSLGPELSIEMTEMIEFVLPIFSSSNLLFFLFITDYETPAPRIAIAGICIGILNAVLPMQWINEKLIYVKLAAPNTQKYKEVENTFKATYQNENPATAQQGKRHFLEKYTINYTPKNILGQMSFNTEDQNNYQFNPSQDNQSFQKKQSPQKQQQQNKQSFNYKLPPLPPYFQAQNISHYNKPDKFQGQKNKVEKSKYSETLFMNSEPESTKQDEDNIYLNSQQFQLITQPIHLMKKDSILESSCSASQQDQQCQSNSSCVKSQESNNNNHCKIIQSDLLINQKILFQTQEDISKQDPCILELDNQVYPFMN